MDCGGGKSILFTLPIYCKYRYGKIDGITIVISPHRIALQQHHATAIDQLRDTDIGIEIFRAGDIDDDFTAETMEKV